MQREISEMRVQITFEVDDDDRAGIAHFVGRHTSGLRGVHRRATREEVRQHIQATISGDLDELRGYADSCDEVRR